MTNQVPRKKMKRSQIRGQEAPSSKKKKQRRGGRLLDARNSASTAQNLVRLFSFALIHRFRLESHRSHNKCWKTP